MEDCFVSCLCSLMFYKFNSTCFVTQNFRNFFKEITHCACNFVSILTLDLPIVMSFLSLMRRPTEVKGPPPGAVFHVGHI